MHYYKIISADFWFTTQAQKRIHFNAHLNDLKSSDVGCSVSGTLKVFNAISNVIANLQCNRFIRH